MAAATDDFLSPTERAQWEAVNDAPIWGFLRKGFERARETYLAQVREASTDRAAWILIGRVEQLTDLIHGGPTAILMAMVEERALKEAAAAEVDKTSAPTIDDDPVDF